MKHVLDPDGSAIDLAASPLWLEHVSAVPAKKRIDLVTSRGADGGVPFGKAPADVMVITYKVRVDEQSTMDEALALLRQLSQLIDEAENQLPGGMALEITEDGSELASTAYVLVGEISDLPREMTGADLGWYHKAPIATITLTCEPFYEGPEETGGKVEGTAPLLELEIPEVKGDVDALGLAIVTEKAGVAKRHYELGLESRYYDPESPAPLLIEGDELDVEGFNGKAVKAPEGAHSSEVVESTLGTEPVTVCSTGDQLHIGQWREKMRFWASSTEVYVRLAWRVGDGSWGRSDWVQATEAEAWLERFLDTINVPQIAVGGQRWEGRIEAYSTAEGGGDTIKVDYLENFPAERWLQVSAPSLPEVPGKSVSKAPGTVEDKEGVGTKPWSTASNAKTSDDNRATVKVKAGVYSHYLQAANFGFALPVGATVLGIVVDMEGSGEVSGGNAIHQHRARIVKAGVIGETEGVDIPDAWPSSDTVQSFGASDDLWGETWTPAQINAATFGFALAVTGTGDEREAKVDAITVTVYYTESQTDPFICAATRELRIDHQLAERYDSTGTYTAPVAEHRGGGMLLPPSGARGRSVRLVSKMRTNDVDAESDTLANSKHKLAVSYIPRYRFDRSE